MLKLITLACLALSLATHAATVSFSNIPSTNTVNSDDLLLLDSHLGGTNYATRTVTVSLIPAANWTASGTTNSTLAGIASVGAGIVGTGPIIVTNAASTYTFHDYGTGQNANTTLGMFTNMIGVTLPANRTIGITAQLNGESIGSATKSTMGAYFYNATSTGDTSYWLYGNSGVYGVFSDVGLRGITNTGPNIGYATYVVGNSPMNIGFAVTADTPFDGPTNQFVFGGAISANTEDITTNVMGLFIEVGNTTFDTDPAINYGVLVLDNRATHSPLIVGRTNNGTQVFQVSDSGSVSSVGSYTSGAPSGGTAAAWKLGSWKTNAVTVIATNYVEVEIGGVLRKLAVVQ